MPDVGQPNCPSVTQFGQVTGVDFNPTLHRQNPLKFLWKSVDMPTISAYILVWITELFLPCWQDSYD